MQCSFQNAEKCEKVNLILQGVLRVLEYKIFWSFFCNDKPSIYKFLEIFTNPVSHPGCFPGRLSYFAIIILIRLIDSKALYLI